MYTAMNNEGRDEHGVGCVMLTVIHVHSYENR